MAAAISVTNFIPEIWDEQVWRLKEDNLVCKKVVNDKSSMVKKAGDTIHFNGLADPSITGSYDGSLTYENLVDSRVSLIVDQKNTYAFVVDDVESAMANLDVKTSQENRAIYKMAKELDAYVFGSTIYGAAGHTITEAALDTSNVLSTISKASRILDEANVPAEDKWMVISPLVKEKLILAGAVFGLNEGMDGRKGGFEWARYRDFTIYVTNNLVTTGSGDTQKSICLAGSSRAIGFAEKLMKSRAIEDKDEFGIFMSGLNVFGAKVIVPEELVKLELTGAAETAV